MDLVPCSTCGRNFSEQALQRHRPICAKNAKAKPRKTFDAQRHRITGTEINYQQVKQNEKKAPTSKELRAADRKHNWRHKHQELVSTIRAARGEDDIPSGGGAGAGSGYGQSYGQSYGAQNNYAVDSRTYNKKSHSNGYGQYHEQSTRSQVPIQSSGRSVPPGYLNCVHCGRNFAEETAERHIPWCEEQQKRKAIKIGNAGKQTAAQKMATRTQYKPPKPVKTKARSNIPQSSGYGIQQTRVPSGTASGYGQQSDYRNTRHVNDDLFDDAPKMAPSAGRRAKQNVLTNFNRDRSAGSKGRRPLRKNCAACQTIYPVDWAKYCCECGTKRN